MTTYNKSNTDFYTLTYIFLLFACFALGFIIARNTLGINQFPRFLSQAACENESYVAKQERRQVDDAWSRDCAAFYQVYLPEMYE